MATTCQDIVNRAAGVSTLNKVLVGDRVEMLTRIRADQRQLFTDVNAIGKNFFQESDDVFSTSGSSARRIDLAGQLSKPLDRLIVVRFTNSGEEISLVDSLDPDAEYAPRAQVQGLTLEEIGNDWQAGAGEASLTITYAYGPTAIDPAGGLNQVVSVPDEWTDVLVLELAAYLVNKDPGRPDAEYVRVVALRDARRTAFMQYVRQYGGPEIRRFQLPGSAEPAKE